MKVILAGYNLDTDVIRAMARCAPGRDDITPETLSASYARISRDPRPINILRRTARKEVERARRSNKTIIFGMGHHSVAEHAVFNFDIIDVSRLAIEAIEHFRLCSYTEKSQRYITLHNEFILPRELEDTGFSSLFIKIVNLQNRFYRRLHKRLYNHILKKHPSSAADPKRLNMTDGQAKEDARYIIGLSASGQLGLTVNARNLELMIRRFAGHKLNEVRQIGRALRRRTAKTAPSIIRLYDTGDYTSGAYSRIAETACVFPKPHGVSGKEVELADYTREGDDIIIAALLVPASGTSFTSVFKSLKKIDADKKKEIMKRAFRDMRFYDSALREFEYAGLTYSMVVSGGCFGQLKRHRLASLVCGEYDPALGVTVPDSVYEIKMDGEFMEIIKKTEELYYKVKKCLPDAAQYILTNAHRRRVLFKCSMRELYHISRLREDAHAQWDIRHITGRMCKLAKDVMPLASMMLCGKDKFGDAYKNIFGFYPGEKGDA